MSNSTVSQVPVDPADEKEKIKQRNLRDLQYIILGAAVALTVTFWLLPNTNPAFPYIGIVSALLWSVKIGIYISRRDWISVLVSGSIVFFLLTNAIPLLIH